MAKKVCVHINCPDDLCWVIGWLAIIEVWLDDGMNHLVKTRDCTIRNAAHYIKHCYGMNQEKESSQGE